MGEDGVVDAGRRICRFIPRHAQSQVGFLFCGALLPLSLEGTGKHHADRGPTPSAGSVRAGGALLAPAFFRGAIYDVGAPGLCFRRWGSEGG